MVEKFIPCFQLVHGWRASGCGFRELTSVMWLCIIWERVGWFGYRVWCHEGQFYVYWSVQLNVSCLCLVTFTYAPAKWEETSSVYLECIVQELSKFCHLYNSKHGSMNFWWWMWCGPWLFDTICQSLYSAGDLWLRKEAIFIYRYRII